MFTCIIKAKMKHFALPQRKAIFFSLFLETKPVMFYAASFISQFADKGELFGWGNSKYGQFFSVTEEQQLSDPTSHVGNIRGIGSHRRRVRGKVCIMFNCRPLGMGTDPTRIRKKLKFHTAFVLYVFVWGYGILGKGPNLEYAR